MNGRARTVKDGFVCLWLCQWGEDEENFIVCAIATSPRACQGWRMLCRALNCIWQSRSLFRWRGTASWCWAWPPATSSTSLRTWFTAPPWTRRSFPRQAGAWSWRGGSGECAAGPALRAPREVNDPKIVSARDNPGWLWLCSWKICVKLVYRDGEVKKRLDKKDFEEA